MTAREQVTERGATCAHWSRTRYVGCRGRAYWICDGCEQVVERAPTETYPAKPEFRAIADELAVMSRQKPVSCVALRDAIEERLRDMYAAGIKSERFKGLRRAHAEGDQTGERDLSLWCGSPSARAGAGGGVPLVQQRSVCSCL